MVERTAIKRFVSEDELEARRKVILAERKADKSCITVCCGTGCQAMGGTKVAETFKDELKKQGLAAKVDVRMT